jgi:hypothetical protein
LSSNNLDDGGTGDGDPGSLDDGGDGGGGGWSKLEKAVLSVLTATVPWVFAFQSFEDFQSWLGDFVLKSINFWVVDNVIRPIVQAVLGIGGTIIESVLVIAFGTDQAIGGRPGLADFALVIATTVVGAVAPAAAALLGVIDSFNQSIADIAASAGLLAPPIVAGLWVAEGAVVAYVAWTVIRVVNLPFVDLDAIIERAFFPVRWLARRVT